MGLLDGRTGIVFGVANKRSIAWAIAQALAGAGMRLAFTYQGDRLRENVEALAGTLPGSVIYPCDVASDGEIGAVFAGVARDLGRLDTLVHSVAFAQREDLEGDFVATSREAGEPALLPAPRRAPAIGGGVTSGDGGYSIMGV